MFMFVGNLVFYFIYDKIKNKLLTILIKNSIKQIEYLPDYEKANNRPFKKLIDFILIDNYFFT